MGTSRSSIFSFDTLSFATARVPKGAIFAVCLLIALEAGLHMVAARLPDPVLWGQGEVSAKIAVRGLVQLTKPVAPVTLRASIAELVRPT